MKLQCSWWRFGSVIWSRGGGNGQRNKYTNGATFSFCVMMSCHGWSQGNCRNTREALEVQAQPGTAQPRSLGQQVQVKQALRGLMSSWPFSLQVTRVAPAGNGTLGPEGPQSPNYEEGSGDNQSARPQKRGEAGQLCNKCRTAKQRESGRKIRCIYRQVKM